MSCKSGIYYKREVPVSVMFVPQGRCCPAQVTQTQQIKARLREICAEAIWLYRSRDQIIRSPEV